MDKSLSALCDALKKIFNHLKPQQNSLSFIVLTGKINQGKTALLRQSKWVSYPLKFEDSAHIFYNRYGVLLELGEAWLNESKHLLAHTLKRINSCHNAITISGLILCVDSGELLRAEPLQLIELCKSHNQLLERFGRDLGYSIPAALFFSKLDTLAGFCEFFHNEHSSELIKSLGFSLAKNENKTQLLENYRRQFDQMVEGLGQQIIAKLHPARSSTKRTLIREFPLQLAGLQIAVQTLLQYLSVPITVHAIYFTSAEQGGVSVDRLNRKIQHEYALTVQDKFPQSTNYRAYFIEGALLSFQRRTQCPIRQVSSWQKIGRSFVLGFTALALVGLFYQHFKTSNLLDTASKELISYEMLTMQSDKTPALYHLTQATQHLEEIPSNLLSVAIIDQLKIQLQSNTQGHIKEDYLPNLLISLEQIITDPIQTPATRYRALKIYLMLGEPKHYSENEVINWFSEFWQVSHPKKSLHKQLVLLRKALQQPLQPIAINWQLVRDARNYLNALPTSYLHYTLAKTIFPTNKLPFELTGFVLTHEAIPSYFTKSGFYEVMASLPKISTILQQENWVLERSDLGNLLLLIQEAYCFEYVSWWKNFMRRIKLEHYQDYHQIKQLIHKLLQNESFNSLIKLIQQETGPVSNEHFGTIFNQKIANQFTEVNLMSNTAITTFVQALNELERFLTTIALISDSGRTVFDLTKRRYEGGKQSDPLSILYDAIPQFSDPIASWAKQLADDIWFIFINESKHFLNHQWEQTVYKTYQTAIANRYPFESSQPEQEIALSEFDNFFAPHGLLNTFITTYLKPFLDTSSAQWCPKELNGYVLPISSSLIDELIRANIITTMFFSPNETTSKIKFSLQKLNLDPIIANLQLLVGKTLLTDNQNSESFVLFNWPQIDAKLTLLSIDGNHYELEEKGQWAVFKLLQKVNVLVDQNDSTSLQIFFEVNGNSGRYLLKTQNPINPFSPGILSGFHLQQNVA